MHGFPAEAQTKAMRHISDDICCKVLLRTLVKEEQGIRTGQLPS
jgi:hypothetical protein